jgi:uncharacterized protein YycO
MSAPTILLFHGKGIMSAAIRWQTRSDYSHAAVLFPDERTIVEAWPGAGVHTKTVTDWTGIDRFAVNADFDTPQLSGFLLSQCGLGYDYAGVLRFLSRSSDASQERKRWFCSELVVAAFEYAGAILFRDSHPWEISPGMLARCPLLEQIEIP